MPKTTFFNLSKEKQNIIIEASLAEFSSHNVHQASVANIVRDSQIARGSFYKYFDDIEDLYYFLYDHVTKKAHGSVMEAIQRADGDLFLGIELYLKELVQAFANEKYHDYFKVVTLNLNYVTQMKLVKQRGPQEGISAVKDFANLINTEQLNISNQQDVMTFFKVLVPVIHECLSDYFAKNWSEEELLAEYHQRVKWLKHGILK